MTVPPAAATATRNLPDGAPNGSPTPAALRAAIGLSALGTLGAAVMAVAHMGIELPLLPVQGLGRAVPVAAAMFTVGALLFALTTWGLVARKSWSRMMALVINAFTLLSGAQPYRGVGSAVGIALSAFAIFFLLLPATRNALRERA